MRKKNKQKEGKDWKMNDRGREKRLKRLMKKKSGSKRETERNEGQRIGD